MTIACENSRFSAPLAGEMSLAKGSEERHPFSQGKVTKKL